MAYHGQQLAASPSDGFSYPLVHMEPWIDGDYTKVKTLAKAIHGKVYLYRHNASGMMLVMKKMPNETVLRYKDTLLEDPQNEIGISFFLSYMTPSHLSSYCVRMLGVFQCPSYTYFATEFCTGGELFEVVSQKQRLDETTSRQYVAQVLLAVEGMHAQGLVHRDISLENTLLHADGTCRILDFAQSSYYLELDKNTGQVKERLLNARAGKDYYRSPEMWFSGYRGPPCDIFACGVLMFIMLFGTPPWRAAVYEDDLFQYISKHSVRKLLVSWRRHNSVSPDAIDLLEKLLKKKIDQQNLRVRRGISKS